MLPPAASSLSSDAAGTDPQSSLAQRFVRRWGVPTFILAVSLTITATSAYYVYASAATAERNRFTHLVQDARDEANRSLDRYLSALRGTVGLYAAFGQVDRRSFDAYAAALDLPEQYRGMRGLGFVARVGAADREAFLEEARRESGAQFKIWSADEPATGPAGGPAASAWSGDVFVVRYVAPAVAVRRQVLGYDMASDPARRAAMVRACDTASAVVTEGLLFIRGTDGERHAGFLIFIPVYGPDGVPGSVDARRRAVTGFVYASFRSDDLMQHIVASNINARLRMRVYDGPATGAAKVLFDSDPPGPDEASFQPLLHDRFNLAVAGATWTVSVTERPPFYMESNAALIPFVLAGGTGISLVLFAVARSQAVARADAERTATVFQQAQRALAASQSRLRRLVDANLIGVFFCDLAGEVSGGNDEFFRMLGQGRGGDGRPLGLGTITIPEDRQHVVEALRQVGRDGVSPAFETAFVRADGPPVPVLLGVASVYPNDVDHIPGAEAVAFALDLSDRYRAEQELRSAKEAAEKANRSKDQFLAMLSHELRTPLTPVLAATAGSAIDPSLPAAVRNDLAMIHRNVELEARLIDDLLDLTRVSRGKLQLRDETVDLHRVIADAVAVVPPESIGNKRLSVEQDLSAPAHHVRGDAARLQQVFWNLVKNAVKFTPPGGRISIRTSNLPFDAGALRVEVADTGLGIEADILPKLFDAFEQGSMARAQASGGLGLGLAISRGLVEAHGGRITAASSGTGQGATFTIELATVPPPPPPSPAPAAGRPSAATAFRILLVEDHADTARVMGRLLTRAGHAVSVAHCVADALREMDRGPFDLLVSDLGLPDGSGTDVVRSFRDRPGNANGNGHPLGAIALTGFGTEDDVNRTRAAGFDEHLTKPVAFDLLEKAIARVMAPRMADVAG
jgi:signal transduction histidine kinase/CHASE1-domain containing sensor protein/ActR/RegA family two-component response regulator